MVLVTKEKFNICVILCFRTTIPDQIFIILFWYLMGYTYVRKIGLIYLATEVLEASAVILI